MSDASQFPITQPYGYDKIYPLNNGFHGGVDYGCPVGTPVVVNGITIGLSGKTGAVTGPHLHLGKWVGGVSQDPGAGKGFTLDNAVVYDTGYDTTNGNFVRINGSGALWVYLHLNSINVTKGQVLDVAEKIDVNASRILQHGILARNGITGRSYALDGSTGDPWVGGELTLQFLNDIFNSPEARGWRDSQDPASVKDVNAKLAQIPVLEKQVADLTKQLASVPAPNPDSVTVTKDSLWTSFKKFLGVK